MNNLKIRKTVLSRAILLAGIAFFVPVSYAQNGEPSGTNSILSLYKDYSTARFAVQWKVPAGDLTDMLAIMPRESFLMYYTSDALLADPQGPFVQFGFFKSAEEADQFVKDNKGAFTGLRVVDVKPAEHAVLMLQAQAGATDVKTKKESVKGYYWLNTSSELGRSALSSLLSEAKELYMNKQYDQALGIYNALSLVPDPEISVWARELKGLCEERLGRKEQALQTYRQLLATGKNEAWVSRVTQRLRTLETAADDDKSALRKSKYGDDLSPFYYRGTVGQFYNYVTVGGTNKSDRDLLSVVATNLDATAGYHHAEHEMEFRVTGYNNSDLLNYPQSNPWGNDNRTVLKRAQVDYTHVTTGIKATGGRQQDFDSGQYMYFDGLTVKYPINNKISVGVNAGVPVQFSDFSDYLDRKFYSLQASYDHNKHWRMAGYITQQNLYSETDRAAWGGRLQYSDERFSSYLNLDYDYKFAELNIFRWTGTYNINQQHQITATYGKQRSPFLSATNILLGQPYLNIKDYLRIKFNEDYLLYNALLRTGIYEYGSLSHQYIVDEKLQITTDLYQSVSSDLPILEYDSQYITSTVVTKGAEYRDTSVGVQAVVADFFGAKDTASLSYRHGDTTLSSSNLVQISERLKFWGDKVYVMPKLSLKYTQKKDTETNSSNLRGALALTYKPWRNVEFRLEAGNEAIRYLDTKMGVNQSYLFVGYQARF